MSISELRFTVFQRDEPGREMSLPANAPVKIGTLPSCGIQLDDDSVSRMHAVIEVSKKLFGVKVTIVDLGSSQGTWVNRKKVSPKATLSNGETFSVGAVKITLHY